MNKYAAIVGIDPGADGFATLYFKGSMWHWPFKTTEDERGKKSMDLDVFESIGSEIRNIVGGTAVLTIFESVNAIPGQSSNAMFSFGWNVAQCYDFAKGLGDVHFVSPIKWMNRIKKEASEMPPFFMKSESIPKGIKPTKIAVFWACLYLYPGIDLTKSSRSKKFHDGKADSIGMCHYGVKLFYNKTISFL